MDYTFFGKALQFACANTSLQNSYIIFSIFESEKKKIIVNNCDNCKINWQGSFLDCLKIFSYPNLLHYRGAQFVNIFYYHFYLSAVRLGRVSHSTIKKDSVMTIYSYFIHANKFWHRPTERSAWAAIQISLWFQLLHTIFLQLPLPRPMNQRDFFAFLSDIKCLLLLYFEAIFVRFVGTSCLTSQVLRNMSE